MTIGVVVTVLLHMVAALLVRRLSVILPAAGMVVMTLAQMALGMAHLKILHVLLGAPPARRSSAVAHWPNHEP
jgi:hypothetical protein